MMKIWLMQIGEPLPFKPGVRKMRTALLADELAARGHDITWWASCFDHMSKRWLEEDDAVYVIADNYRLKLLRGLAYKKNLSLRRFLDHRIIARKFRTLAPALERPDIIVASFPSHDLAFEAVRYARANDIPIIVDVRDQWPDIFLEYFPAGIAPLFRLILYNDFRMAREALKDATCLTSMMNNLLNWGVEKAGRAPRDCDRVFYLGAQRPQQPEAGKNERLQGLDAAIAGKFVVIFIGTFGNYYNPMILVEAARRLRGAAVHFIIGGDGAYGDSVRQAASGLENVSLTGWLNQAEIEHLLPKAHLGVVPCTARITAFPNKVFTYFSAGIPIISSLDGDLKEILQKHRLGVYYEPNATDQFVSCIEGIMKHSDEYESLKNNVVCMYSEKYDSNLIYKQYADYVELIVQKNNSILQRTC
jgi:glycosyltransferase involved in cell wall biosynthesis